MRTLTLSLALLATVAALAACGPSNKELATAKTARYTGDKAVLFNAAKTAAEGKARLAKVDEAALGFQTIGRWYTLDGMLAPGSDEDMRQVPDKSIRLTLVVTLRADGDNWLVVVEPSMLRKLTGSPAPQKLEPTDPDVPGFIQGQVDAMQFEIWNAMKQYEVKTLGGIPPGPEPTPGSAAPADPAAAPADPAAGSAAPAPAP